MHAMEVRMQMVIVLIVLVQTTILTPMVGDLLNGMDSNLLKVVADNLKVEVDNLMADSLMVAVNNHLKVVSKNLLAMDDLITLHLRILKLALR
jgi:hypothetical protein